MTLYQVEITDEQDAALAIIADEAGKTPQEIVDEQMVYYIKEMLNRKVKTHGITLTDDETSTDAEKAQVAAVMLKAKDDFLKSKNGNQ